MKVTNIILSVLILLMAIASAVFSYFLFEKRTMFVSGWGKMAVAINKTAAALDKDSVSPDNALAKKLTPQALSHEKYGDLDKLLPELAKRSEQIIVERDGLADALRRIGNTVEAKVPAENVFRNLDTYNGAKNNIVAAVADAVRRRDQTFRNFIRVSSKLGVTLNARTLKSGDTSVIAPLEKAVDNLVYRRNNYEGTLRNIGKVVEVTRFDNSDAGYRNSARAVHEGVINLSDRHKKTLAQLDSANATIRRNENTISQNKQKIASLNKTIADKDVQIRSYMKALGLKVEDEPPMPWKDGSDEARKALVGRVVEVHDDYGYVAFNIGRNTTVFQPLGNKKLEVKPLIEKGMDMIICRGELGNDSEFIARIKLDEIGDSCSTANIPVGAKKIKVGDYVYYSPANK